MREREGAVYSIGAYGQMSRIGDHSVVMGTTFPMKPELKDKVLGIIAGEFKAMENNVTDAELNKVKEFMVKTLTAGFEKNENWLNAISGACMNGVDTFNDAVDVINAITVEDVQDFMKQLNAQGNYRVVVLDPETASAE